ncbi:FAD-binding domain-containing protein [Pseudovirgaria hyperparasitica]|uniref:FAD-binding domain-containing protein n=1 Tax=Pseudovirgaria hyperparasitica TaxID=470096 RepID=A0A6A6W2I7_9PEZI|nr:FAD-binding domain-containing protein [Pseudovirgaria hyperparasitica]KAF2756793.1 FAD-binding domain-containing protein [Pseudovirgaria hyperparasitica]
MASINYVPTSSRTLNFAICTSVSAHRGSRVGYELGKEEEHIGDPLSTQLLNSIPAYSPNLESGASSRLVATIKRSASIIDGAEETLGTTGESTAACKIFQTLFGNRTISSGNPSYTPETDVNWSQTCWLPASCFVQVQTTTEVLAALKVATCTQSKFAIRNRGHNPNPRFASIENGVLIDLEAAGDKVSVDVSRGIVSTGLGASFIDVYNATDKYNVSAIGGRDGDVGVAGVILGGGMPYFGNLYGLAYDNVKEFEIWYSLVMYTHNETSMALEGVEQLHAYMEADPKLGFFLNFNPTGLYTGLFYAEWTEWPTANEPFRKLDPVMAFAPPTNGTVALLAAAIGLGPEKTPLRSGTF